MNYPDTVKLKKQFNYRPYMNNGVMIQLNPIAEGTEGILLPPDSLKDIGGRYKFPDDGDQKNILHYDYLTHEDLI